VVIKSLEEITKSPPSVTLNEIKGVSPEAMSKCNVDWRVVGQFCATQAYNCHISRNQNGVVDWSELGKEIYRRLQVLMADDDDELAEMRIRANAIVFCGVNPSESVLNPSVVESWFFSKLPGSMEQVRQMAMDIDDAASPAFLTLRRLKQRLSLIKGLVDQGVFAENDQLAKWLAVRDELP
jgi:hypothetical protein